MDKKKIYLIICELIESNRGYPNTFDWSVRRAFASKEVAYEKLKKYDGTYIDDGDPLYGPYKLKVDEEHPGYKSITYVQERELYS